SSDTHIASSCRLAASKLHEVLVAFSLIALLKANRPLADEIRDGISALEDSAEYKGTLAPEAA
ncbi:MAG: hypothetical protein ACYC2K_10035, partial [Gemmatimonadales bacterium]